MTGAMTRAPIAVEPNHWATRAEAGRRGPRIPSSVTAPMPVIVTHPAAVASSRAPGAGSLRPQRLPGRRSGPGDDAVAGDSPQGPCPRPTGRAIRVPSDSAGGPAWLSYGDR